MRIIAGQARGRKITAPSGPETRPTSDRAREAIFNALGSRGLVVGANVIDLFAGSGALGLEAWSRGAANVICVDNDTRAVRVLRENIEKLGAQDTVSAVSAEAMGWLAVAHRRCDLLLADPPYAFERWPDLLASIQTSAALVESDRPVGAPQGWEQEYVKRYGRSCTTLLVRTTPEVASDELG
ncbi:MAG: 16S rRNA (guanine(966)-N(2))-methyltransferase RsmD [Acidimicrobiales bacterium]